MTIRFTACLLSGATMLAAGVLASAAAAQPDDSNRPTSAPVQPDPG
jgi:hypothetical protein